MKPIYVNNSDLMELISDIAHRIVMTKFGDDCLIPEDEDTMMYSDEAQDFFNDTYDEIEGMFDTTCGIISDIHKGQPKEGDDVTIVIPFTYTLGEPSYTTGDILNTIEDCKSEVLRELDNGFPYGDEVYLEVLL